MKERRRGSGVITRHPYSPRYAIEQAENTVISGIPRTHMTGEVDVLLRQM